MILKLLLITAVIGIVYMMFFKQKSIKKEQEPQKNKQQDADINELIQCPTCGVYVEVEEAILSGATYYCSLECIQKAS